MEINIVDAYIKFKGQLIIFISGLSGCGKTKVARKISRDLNLQLIEQFNYYKHDHDEKVTLSNGKTVVNWSTDKAICCRNFEKSKNN